MGPRLGERWDSRNGEFLKATMLSFLGGAPHSLSDANIWREDSSLTKAGEAHGAKGGEHLWMLIFQVFENSILNHLQVNWKC